ncbi:hypothetical protein F4814DRAFT_376886 [Daldinia grandis]|nr:hypothetical protein F4814DRAFT_376886 [Daldinia grandis]
MDDLAAAKDDLIKSREKHELGTAALTSAHDSQMRSLEQRIEDLGASLRAEMFEKSSISSALEARDAVIATLKAQICQKDESILRLKASYDEEKHRADDMFDQKTEESGQVAELTGKLEEAARRLLELDGRIPQLEGHIKAGELRVAQFFAEHSSWDGNNYDGWLPFGRAVVDAEGAVGSGPLTTLPWVLLEIWTEDPGQQLNEYSHPSDVIMVACKLYGFALGGHYHGEAMQILGLLMRRLAKDDSARVAPVLLALDRYLGIAEELRASSDSIHLQMFFFGLWRLASLITSRWPSVPAAEGVRDRLGKHLDGRPLLKLEELLGDENLEVTLREKSPRDYFFSEDLGVGFAQLSELRHWVFAVDVANRTVRMFHFSRANWSSIYNITITAARSKGDLVVPVHTKGQFDWVSAHMY